jgi:hypothetical protein
MPDLTFGKQLKNFRQQTRYPVTGRSLTQQQLGDFLQEEMGVHYTGAAISDWERDKAKPGINDRPVLLSLIKILKQYEGIKTLTEANLLLEAGNYRDLNLNEREKVFPEESREATQQNTSAAFNKLILNFKFLFGSIFFNSPEELQKILDEANAGAAPAWTSILVSVINKITDQWSIFHVLKVLLWMWIWLLTYLFLIPSLRLPFLTQEDAFIAVFFYAIGTAIVPPLIGGMVNTKDQMYWKEKKISNSPTTRLYVFQGAYIGFHLGYFLLFPLALLQSQFQIQSTISIEFMLMAIPIAIGYAGAYLVPYNLIRAYKRLDLKDGYIFFIFVVVGPAWAWFLFNLHSQIGMITLLTAITLLTIAMAIQYKKQGNTIIPVLWIIIFYGLIFICQIISALFNS